MIEVPYESLNVLFTLLVVFASVHRSRQRSPSYPAPSNTRNWSSLNWAVALYRTSQRPALVGRFRRERSGART